VSLYESLLFVHVLAAAAWFGAALLSVVLMELAVRAQDIAWIMRFGEYDDTLAKVLFIPSALLVLITGVALVFEGPWSFTDDGWVLAGIVLLAGIFALGLGTIVPAGKKLVALGSSGAPQAELQDQLRKLRLLSWLDVALLAVALFVMTTKPF
jgi:uncharacterized membrane protein